MQHTATYHSKLAAGQETYWRSFRTSRHKTNRATCRVKNTWKKKTWHQPSVVFWFVCLIGWCQKPQVCLHIGLLAAAREDEEWRRRERTQPERERQSSEREGEEKERSPALWWMRGSELVLSCRLINESRQCCLPTHRLLIGRASHWLQLMLICQPLKDHLHILWSCSKCLLYLFIYLWKRGLACKMIIQQTNPQQRRQTSSSVRRLV